MSDLHNYGLRCPACGCPERPLRNDGCDIVFECVSSMGVSFGRPVPDRFKQSATCQLIVAQKDAARYRFIRDELARRLSLQMNATAAWRVQSPSGRHPTFDAAIDSMMEQQKAAGGGG